VESTLWALEELAEAGFEYDSSIFPIRHKRYGIPNWPRTPVTVRLASGRRIVELPLGTVRLLHKRLPVAGGGYHRLLPWPVIRRSIQANLDERHPFIAYCHPYEFDATEFDEIDFRVPLKTRLHQGIGRKGFQAKFERMLATFHACHGSAVARNEWPEHHITSPRAEALTSG
jgi:hypothetical protein